MNKLMYVWFAVKTLFSTCDSDHKVNNFKRVRSEYKISKIGKLPSLISESSGLARSQNANIFWSHNDSGGKPELYGFDLSGKLISIKTIPQARNADWEDLAEDKLGNIYIGDFGNNAAIRSEYEIYKHNTLDSTTQVIKFKYAEQQKPSKNSAGRIFDSEAFFHHGNSLYLFSKNWGDDPVVRMYRISDKPGDYVVSVADSIPVNAQVTSADISPDGKRFVLLTYGKVLVFEVSDEGVNFSKPVGCFRLVKKQNEAILFLNNTDMLVTAEQGDMYRITYR
ncbi:hypothetical protein [Dyadobacter sp. Leaf189]|uniref:hypothetical protein n=1 Tax=Dyadobacter sp. Leaf189 TaxID=1736295 RepID=UPI0006F6FD7F|nr:hypothetical protein [Dyadobacter sp. Leaf189]KQS32723.1 hypothetical protein ASG33_00995 [Dyadobacter sp. Leaf189]